MKCHYDSVFTEVPHFDCTIQKMMTFAGHVDLYLERPHTSFEKKVEFRKLFLSKDGE